MFNRIYDGGTVISFLCNIQTALFFFLLFEKPLNLLSFLWYINMSDQGVESLGPRGLTIEQQRKIAAIQSQAATESLRASNERFSVDRVESSLYVGELGPEVNDDILKQHFKLAKSVHVCRDRVSGKSLGYAYVNFSRAEDCKLFFL